MNDYKYWSIYWNLVMDYKKNKNTPQELATKYNLPIEKVIDLLGCYGY